jgi:DNA-binding NarL/FixJ family response regulator
MKIKRPLPPAPKITTKTVRNDHLVGYGVYTYESPVPQTVMDLRIPPTRSDSQAAERERELKTILDLAREGKTATEISEATGCSKVRISQTINRFAEYGAKLAPEPKKKQIDKRKLTMWTDEMEEQLIALHHEGLTFAQIAKEIGVSKGAISSKVRSLVEAEVLKPRMQEIMWTKEEMDRMFQMRAEGKMWGEIADKLGRKITACHNAYGRERERRKKCQKG